MKKVFKLVGIIAIPVVIIVTLLMLFLYEEEESVENQLAGLMACVVTGTCQIPTSQDSLVGMDFLGVYLRMPEKNVNIKYLVGGGVVMVVMVVDKDNQVTLTDVDFDGTLDAVGIIKDGQIVQPENTEFTPWQSLYGSSLSIAWSRVVPEKIKEALKNMPPDISSPPTKPTRPKIKV